MAYQQDRTRFQEYVRYSPRVDKISPEDQTRFALSGGKRRNHRSSSIPPDVSSNRRSERRSEPRSDRDPRHPSPKQVLQHQLYQQQQPYPQQRDDVPTTSRYMRKSRSPSPHQYNMNNNNGAHHPNNSHGHGHPSPSPHRQHPRGEGSRGRQSQRQYNHPDGYNNMSSPLPPQSIHRGKQPPSGPPTGPSPSSSQYHSHGGHPDNSMQGRTSSRRQRSLSPAVNRDIDELLNASELQPIHPNQNNASTNTNNKKKKQSNKRSKPIAIRRTNRSLSDSPKRKGRYDTATDSGSQDDPCGLKFINDFFPSTQSFEDARTGGKSKKKKKGDKNTTAAADDDGVGAAPLCGVDLDGLCSNDSLPLVAAGLLALVVIA